ncbi:MAG: DUF3471 domain-containing protein [Spirosomataceae bacterium]
MKKLSIFFLLAFPILLQAQDLRKYVGTYAMVGPYQKIEIKVENGALYGLADGSDGSKLEKTQNPDEFLVVAYGATAKFTKNAKGLITQVILTVQGENYTATRKDPNPTDYAGDYQMSGAPFDVLTISPDGNGLKAIAPGVGEGPLQDTEIYDEFFEANNGATIRFTRDEKGMVRRVIILVQGMELIGEKK